MTSTAPSAPSSAAPGAPYAVAPAAGTAAHAAGGASAAAPALRPGLLEPGRLWRNWSRAVVGHPAALARPRDEDEVREVVRRAAELGLPVRVVGAGHSFTPCAETEGILVSLDHLAGLVAVDREARTATVRAGTRLHALFPLLDAHGLALPNQGDIDRQAIAGAVSTGTHGTGLGFTGLAGMVVGMRLVTADGEVRELSASRHPEELELARLSLGALGVITELTLQCVDAFDLHAVERGASFDEAVDGFLERCEAVDHTEFYWFPHAEGALIKENRRIHPGEETEAGRRSRLARIVDDELVGNGIHRLACEVGRAVRPLVGPINRLSTELVSGREYRERSHEVFVSPRRTRFRETEYAVPLEAVPECIRAVRRLIEERRWRIEFPIEVRAAAADDVALSTAFERASGYIAVHRFNSVRDSEYFREVERIMRAHAGRPHWGKLHSLGAEELAGEYRRMPEFLALRDRLDPDRRFQNGYTRRVLGE